MQAEEGQTKLAHDVNQLLVKSQDLSRRMMDLEVNFDPQTITASKKKNRSSASIISAADTASATSPPLPQASTASPTDTPLLPTASQVELSVARAFEDDLKTSGPYRRAKRQSMDFSFCSSVPQSHAWSALSGLSLSNISVMSVVALPVYADEIANSARYAFAGGLLPISDSDPQENDPAQESLLHQCLRVTYQLALRHGFHPLLGKILTDRWHQHGQHPFQTLKYAFQDCEGLKMARELCNVLEHYYKPIDCTCYKSGPHNDYFKRIHKVLSHSPLLKPEEMITKDDLANKRGSDTRFLRVSVYVFALLTSSKLKLPT